MTNTSLVPAARRHGAARASLLALPAALSLAGPAAGQTALLGSSTGIDLNTYGPGPFSIGGTTSISSTGLAALAGSQSVQITNAGHVSDPNGVGVYLGGGGTLANNGTIIGANAVSLNAPGSIGNSGIINAANYGILANGGAASVDNSGAISAGFDGVSLNQGGQASNSGTIHGGHIGLYTGYGLASVSNSGEISASNGDAVSLYTGGNLTNTATGRLLGGYNGAFAGGNGAQILNAGLIAAPDAGVYFTGASSLTNSGTIAGGTDGFIDLGHGGVVENRGKLTGAVIGARFVANGSLTNSGVISGGTTGVDLGRAGTLTNAASGVTTGGNIGLRAGPGSVIDNAGRIAGATGLLANGAVTITDSGAITAAQGGNAISFNGGASTLTLATGAVITGAIAGNGTASQISLTGNGVLNSDITGLNAGGALQVAQGASWTGSGNWTVAQVVNAGILTPGLIAAPLTINGDFIQTSTGTLRVAVTPRGIAPFTINGTAQLGGTLLYILAPGTYSPATDHFLTASGGVNGNFAQVTSSQPQIQPVSLGTGGQITLHQSIAVAPLDAALFPAITQALTLGARMGDATLLAQAARPHASCTPPITNATSTQGQLAAALAGGFCAAGGWVQATGTDLSTSGGFNAQGGGFLAGLGRPIPATGGQVGIAAGFDSVNLKDKASGKARLQTIRIGLYARQPVGAFMLSADIMDGIASLTTTRQTGAGTATAKGHANVLSGAVQAAAPLRFGATDITPALGLEITHVSTGRLNEVAATQAFAVTASGTGGTSVAPYLRVDMSQHFITRGGIAITPRLGLGVMADLDEVGSRVTLTAQDGTGFGATPHHLAPIAGQIMAGVRISRGAWALQAGYSASLAGNWSAQTVQAGLAVRF